MAPRCLSNRPMKTYEGQEHLKKVKVRGQDELQAEFDLKSLLVRKVGPGRKSFVKFVVQLKPDVAEVFPDADSVNEALSFLIRMNRENKQALSENDGSD